MSGANSTPLGRMNPAIGAGKKSVGSSLLNPSYMTVVSSNSNSSNGSSSGAINPPMVNLKRELEDSGPRKYENAAMTEEELAREERKRRRKSRWQGDEKEKTFIPGMPTVLPTNMSQDQEQAYLLQLQIEEFSRRLRTNDLGIPANPEDRSPSPEPIYNNEGKRLNTREYRTRKKLEDDRHNCIQLMFELNPDYKPPADYKPPVVKVSDKVMIPQEEHPDINFVGLLIGPRGNTLKAMEKDTGAKIIIRGKGSVKEGKVGRKDGGPLPGEDEPLHAYVTASNPESVKKAVDRIKEIIRQGVEVPEGQNDLRRMQLRELALLNGTLRENDGPRCSNCGSSAHKSWQCPDKPNVTNNVVCTSCGGAGHIARDCRQRRGPGAPQTTGGVDRQKIDEEYMSLMAELGEGPPPPQNSQANNARTARSSIPSLFDRPQAPPRALMAPLSRTEAPSPAVNTSPQSPTPLLGNPNNWNSSNNQFGGNRNNVSNGTPPNLNQPPPGMPWQQQQHQQPSQQQGMQNNNNNFQGVPPPNLLQAPPPPPPPTSSSGHQQQQQQQQPNWMSQAPPGPPGGPPGPPGGPPGPPGGPPGHHGPPGPSHGPPQMNHWQGGPPPGPPGIGCPPPGPVPPPRPVGPPPGWGWNGPQPVGPPPPPPPPGGPSGPGPRGPGGVDLGALLSAPPPPPPS